MSDGDLSVFSSILSKHPEGYWSAGDSEAVSFPEGGYDMCYSVEEDSFWFRHRNAVITAVIQRFPPRGTLFDIGGGNGYVAIGLEEAGFPVVLVEPGPSGARHALDRGLEHIICSTVEAAGFVQQALPAVGLFDVLEHVEDVMAFLQYLHSLIRPHGRIYATVPAYQVLWSHADEQAGHYRWYSMKQLANCFEHSGFTVEYLTHFFWFLPLPILLLRTIPSRIRMRQPFSIWQTQQEHSAGGAAGWLVGHALAVELSRIHAAQVIPFGGSCLIVAQA